MPLHVLRTYALHQEVKLHYTASGIITPIGVMIPVMLEPATRTLLQPTRT